MSEIKSKPMAIVVLEKCESDINRWVKDAEYINGRMPPPNAEALRTLCFNVRQARLEFEKVIEQLEKLRARPARRARNKKPNG